MQALPHYWLVSRHLCVLITLFAKEIVKERQLCSTNTLDTAMLYIPEQRVKDKYLYPKQAWKQNHSPTYKHFLSNMTAYVGLIVCLGIITGGAIAAGITLSSKSKINK